MYYDDLNDSNVLLYAIKCYDKPNCIQSEFAEDYRAFRYIKRLLQKYRDTGKIKERLILILILFWKLKYQQSQMTLLIIIMIYKMELEQKCLI